MDKGKDFLSKTIYIKDLRDFYTPNGEIIVKSWLFGQHFRNRETYGLLVDLLHRAKKEHPVRLEQMPKELRNLVRAGIVECDLSQIVELDYKAIYKLYPRRGFEREGIELLRKIVLSKEEYEAVRKGVIRYAKDNLRTHKNNLLPFNNWVFRQEWKVKHGG